MMYSCADCTVYACRTEEKENMPLNCPMRNRENMDRIAEEYQKESVAAFHRTAALVESEGYCQWPRLRETMEFARKMGYRKLGLAFCFGLRREAKTLVQILRKNGFSVDSVMCKTGGYDKNTVGIEETQKLCGGGYEAMCNPIAQAQLLNQCGTELNIVLGLCVGHDSLFYRYSDAMVTTLVAKDRALAHNPVGAIYQSEAYLRNKMHLEEK